MKLKPERQWVKMEDWTAWYEIRPTSGFSWGKQRFMFTGRWCSATGPRTGFTPLGGQRVHRKVVKVAEGYELERIISIVVTKRLREAAGLEYVP